MNAFRFAGNGEFAETGGNASSRRLDMTYALTRMVMNEMRDPLSVAKGYGEMLSRDASKGTDTRVLGVMGGIDRIGALLSCVSSMFDTPMVHRDQAEVEPILKVAAEFVRLTHHPTPSIELDLVPDPPAVAMPAIDLQHLVLAMVMSACDAASPSTVVVLSTRLPEDMGNGDASMMEIGVTYPVLESENIDSTVVTPIKRRGRQRGERKRWLGFSVCRDIVHAAGGRMLIDSIGADRRKTTAVVPIASDVVETTGALSVPAMFMPPMQSGMGD